MNKLFKCIMYYLKTRFKTRSSNGYTSSGFLRGEITPLRFTTKGQVLTEENQSTTRTGFLTSSESYLTEGYLPLRLSGLKNKNHLKPKPILLITSTSKAALRWLHGRLSKLKTGLKSIRGCRHDWSIWQSSQTKSKICSKCGLRKVIQTDID